MRTESFVFGTRLTRVTRLLRDRDRDRALARVSDAVNDWAGGTRIGESFRTFNQHWARRSLRTSGVVIVVSDGWDRGDPALVAAETARLRRNCHRLVWLNPLAGTPGYQPLAGGMRAAFPYIDDFLPAGTVASLERLGEILGGVRSADTRQGAEAAAHAARPGVADLTPRVRAAAPSVGGTPDRPEHREADPMKELLETLATWQGEGIDAGRAVVVRTFGSAPRPEGAVLLYAADGRIAGSVSGGCVEGAAAEEIEHARATGNARVIRYGISDEQAWDVGLACGGTIDVLVEPAVPSAAVARPRPSRSGPAGTVPPSSRRSPPTRRRPTAARTSRATGAPPEPPLVVHEDGRLDGTLGDPALDAALVDGALEALRARPVADGRARRTVAVRRGLPGPAATGRRRCGRGRALARPAREGARLRDRRHRRARVVRDAASASPTSIGWSSAGPTRSPTRSGSGRTTRSPC